MDRFCGRSSPSLEALLQHLLQAQASQEAAVGGSRVPRDLLSLACRVGRALPALRLASDCKLSESFSPHRFGRTPPVCNLLMPWALGPSWADGLLRVAGSRYIHVRGGAAIAMDRSTKADSS